jgi:hypothetical protein
LKTFTVEFSVSGAAKLAAQSKRPRAALDKGINPCCQGNRNGKKEEKTTSKF